MRHTALVTFIFLLFLGNVVPIPAHAQNEAVGTAISLHIVDKNIRDGSIISSTSSGYIMTIISYDSNMYGVYTESPSVYFKNTNDTQAKPVIISGKTKVLVSSINGNIKKNDFITSSTIPGVGQKANKNGTVLGTALEDYSNSDKNTVGKIYVTINPHYIGSISDNRTNVLELIRNATAPTTLSQIASLRYLLATLIVIIAFIIGFIYFGNVTSRGVEAIGRNPLAKRTIQLNLILNFFLMICIIGAAIAIGYLILII